MTCVADQKDACSVTGYATVVRFCNKWGMGKLQSVQLENMYAHIRTLYSEYISETNASWVRLKCL
jgi:hypothetical protein